MKRTKQSLLTSWLLWVIAVLMAALGCALSELYGTRDTLPTPSAAPMAEGEISPGEESGAYSLPTAGEGAEEGQAREAVRWDEGQAFPVRFADGTVRTVTMAEFLPGVLAGEMPASFAQEALCAQAVAARTYILSALASPPRDAHPEAAVCTDPGCCQAWCSEEELRALWGGEYDYYRARVDAAVQDTDGTCLTWEGKPILSCFHASSLGRTEDSGSVWSTALPYLVSVSSPESVENVPGLVTTLTLSPGELRRAVERVAAPALGEDPAGWLGETIYDTAGRVSGMMLGGVYLSGNTLRSLFSLRSTDFTLRWTGTEFLFTVAGYGHGVGMSQYGAELMAGEGYGWEEILQHYYPGALLEHYGGSQPDRQGG